MRVLKSVGSLAALERIITRWQLVEYRPTLDMIVKRLESPSYEVAVFGRVSSGKSSLLNHIAGTDVLPGRRHARHCRPDPVGIRREAHGPSSRSPRRPPATSRLSQLWEYASEEGNPGNCEARHRDHRARPFISSSKPGRASLTLPVSDRSRLPGLRRRLAYLPRCDLGIVLIDGASSLGNPDDLALLRSTLRSGHPGDGSSEQSRSALDVRSRADGRPTSESHSEQELGLNLPVHPVSVVGADESLLPRWYDSEISPLLERHQSLVEVSIRRKIASLSESVATSLETLLLRVVPKRISRSRRGLPEPVTSSTRRTMPSGR